MKQTSRIIIISLLLLSMLAALYTMSCVGFWISLNIHNGVFSRSVPDGERQMRTEVVTTALTWLGITEKSEEHSQLLAVYNGHEPLPRGYVVTGDDNWCAAFGTCVAIQCNLTDLIPAECGCERQIELWKNMGRWTENDNHVPLPGDYIYYNWNEKAGLKDNTGWADHVGIVVGTSGPLIKVIEGNKDDSVSYRIIFRGDYRIRGFGLPDYASQ